MKIRVFQSDKGDCLLLTSSDGKHMLVDGGMVGSYRKHVAPHLGAMREARESLDLVYVSHIDQDHIAGILAMMDDEVAWRVHDFQIASGNQRHRRPARNRPRPPEVKSVWHNAFHEQVGKNHGEIEDMLAAEAAVLTLRSDDFAHSAADEMADLATSKAEAVRLSRRIGDRQLNIPLNEEYGGRLMFVADPPTPISLGTMEMSVIGPFAEDLKELREEWNAWLRSAKGRRQLRQIARRSREDEDSLGHADIDGIFDPLIGLADRLGDRDNVTTPNLASLMLLVEEDSHSVLLTGDGHGSDVLSGLFNINRLNDEAAIHVDVLKVLHHGSEHNLDAEFCKQVTADHYIFCGNGAHENPDLRVVRTLINSRIGSRSQLSGNAETGNPFKLWFNSSEDVTDSRYKSHMRKIERLVRDQARRSNSQMTYHFIKRGSSFAFDL